jgi:uncharacterized protein (UPF0261 family)
MGRALTKFSELPRATRLSHVILIGTLDTKGREVEFVRERLRAAGAAVTLIDVGIRGKPTIHADVTRGAVARAGGASLEHLRALSRGEAERIVSNGARVLVQRISARAHFEAIIGVGGSGGTAIIAPVMRSLPIGLPKVLVSTMAAGDTRPYVSGSDIFLVNSVADIAGLNSITTAVLANAAQAAAGMASHYRASPAPTRDVIGATMLGVTSRCVDAARARLESFGYEVWVFHANGAGGQAFEQLIAAGVISAALDATTHELADEVVGGIMSAGPRRLEAAGQAGIPQVVSVGGLSSIIFGSAKSVPQRFSRRDFVVRDESMRFMRTSVSESTRIGSLLGRKLQLARGPCEVYVPEQGFQDGCERGQAWHRPEADRALVRALLRSLPKRVPLVQLPLHINDTAFATAMADGLHAMILSHRTIHPKQAATRVPHPRD